MAEIKTSPNYPLSKALWVKAKKEYEKGSRKYHNVEYIEEGFKLMQSLHIKPTLAQEIAWIAHKVVLDPTSSCNEQKSADWIDSVFKNMQVGEKVIIKEAKMIIMSTADYIPQVPSAEPILDIILSRLAVNDANKFDDFAWKLKAESPDFDEVEWIKRSKVFFQSMLEREDVFCLTESKRRWGRRFKENLINAIQQHPLSQKRLFGMDM